MLKKMTRSVTAILLAVSLLAPTIPSVAQKPWMLPSFTGAFHADKGRFVHLSKSFETRINLIKHYALEKHPVLKLQYLKENPNGWISETLSGRATDHTNLVFRSDNLYLSAFTNSRNKWIRFNDKSKYKIPESLVLKFGSDYRDLVGDDSNDPAWRKLIGLDIGRDSILDAIAVLYNCIPGKTPDSAIKLAATKLTVITVEAARFPYIRDFVNEAWTKEEAPTKLDERAAKLIVNWKTISCAVLIWAIDKKRWDHEEAIELAKPYPYGLGIATVEEALATIFPVLQSTTCSVPFDQYQHA